MPARTFPTKPRRIPDDQFAISVPLLRSEDELRYGPRVPVAESYRTNLARIWPDGEGGPVFDVVPTRDPPSDGPGVLFSATQEVFLVSGQHSFGRPSTRAENAETLRRLRWLLDFQGWTWCPSTVLAPRRDWVEQGAVVREARLDEVIDLARRHGQDVILRWDADGLAPVVTRSGTDLAGAETPVPVRVEPARTGCPFRDGVDDWCVQYGGPYTRSSRIAALVWETHRAMLVDALGCQVCGGGAVSVGSPMGATELFTPSRQGGWQWGPPRTRDEIGTPRAIVAAGTTDTPDTD